MGRAKKSKHQRNRLLKRVLGSPRGRGQALLAIFGFVLGLILLLGSLNLALGIHRATRRDAEHAEYLVVNKQVTMTGMLTYIRPTFTESEIEELREQPFVQEVGEFTSNHFQVSAVPASVEGAPSDQERTEPGDGVGMELPLYTDLFFESVPDRFLDVQPDNWEWSSDSRYLPIIMSREFLNLYNFAFALAQGLPQIPESMLDRVGGRVTVSGKGGERTMQARVVGLSDRIPSIIVPVEFMRWANREIAEEEQKRPSRLTVRLGVPCRIHVIRVGSAHGKCLYITVQYHHIDIQE